MPLDVVKNQILSFLDRADGLSEEEAFAGASLYCRFLQRLSPEERSDMQAILRGPEAKILEVLAREAPERTPEEAEIDFQYNRACSHDPTIGVWIGENGPEPARPLDR